MWEMSKNRRERIQISQAQLKRIGDQAASAARVCARKLAHMDGHRDALDAIQRGENFLYGYLQVGQEDQSEDVPGVAGVQEFIGGKRLVTETPVKPRGLWQAEYRIFNTVRYNYGGLIEGTPPLAHTCQLTARDYVLAFNKRGHLRRANSVISHKP